MPRPTFVLKRRNAPSLKGHNPARKRNKYYYWFTIQSPNNSRILATSEIYNERRAAIKGMQALHMAVGRTMTRSEESRTPEFIEQPED
jgi:uncharacterized protein YegP (UPF0339 family)